jgi:hypothetical protein
MGEEGGGGGGDGGENGQWQHIVVPVMVQGHCKALGIEMALQTLETTQRRTTNLSMRALFDRVRVLVRLRLMDNNDDGRYGGGSNFVMLGDIEGTAKNALLWYMFDKQTYVNLLDISSHLGKRSYLP